jgi:Flp pilus assembly protein TadG
MFIPLPAIRNPGGSFRRLARLKRAAARWRHNDAGASAVEFALLAPVVTAFVLGTLMAAALYFAKSELDLVAQKVSREVMTGQISTASQLQTAICANTSGLLNCNSIMVNLQNYTQLSSLQTATPTLTYKANGAVSNNWTTNFGTVGSIMVMQLMYQYPLIAGPLFNFSSQSNNTSLLVSTAVFVNE